MTPAALAPEGDALVQALAQADGLLLGTLAAQERGGTGMSMPPVHTGTLRLDDVESLRGTPPDPLRYGARQLEPPTWTVGTRYLAATRGENLTVVVEATADVVTLARATAALPFGWRAGAEGPVSPWPDARPPWLAGSGLVLGVEQVPPEVPTKFKNDYGDGRFEITLTNPGSAPVTVEALRRDASGILWQRSLLVSTSQVHLLSKDPLPPDTQPVVLAPGEAVSTVVDTLTLDGVSWPHGGARVALQFALGELAASSFFYYSSDLHDPMRAARTR